MAFRTSSSHIGNRTDPAHFWATEVTARTIERLRDPAELDEAADRLSAAVLGLRCEAVAGASPVGQRLALAVASRTGLATWGPAEELMGPVAVLDAAVNSGVNIVRVIRAIRASGGHDVVGVALLAHTVAVAAWGAEGETLVALEEI